MQYERKHDVVWQIPRTSGAFHKSEVNVSTSTTRPESSISVALSTERRTRVTNLHHKGNTLLFEATHSPHHHSRLAHVYASCLERSNVGSLVSKYYFISQKVRSTLVLIVEKIFQLSVFMKSVCTSDALLNIEVITVGPCCSFTHEAREHMISSCHVELHWPHHVYIHETAMDAPTRTDTHILSIIWHLRCPATGSATLPPPRSLVRQPRACRQAYKTRCTFVRKGQHDFMSPNWSMHVADENRTYPEPTSAAPDASAKAAFMMLLLQPMVASRVVV